MATNGQPEFHKAGDRIGHYEILGLIGRGGMGVVYRAQDLNLDREVALKRPLRRYLIDQRARGRFYREARAASRLQHPNIVTIFEVFEEGGYDWMSMELVKGHNLGRYLTERGPLRPREVVRHGEGLADALREAHRQNIIHRDINPNNILVDRQGFARLTDFGLARFQGSVPMDSDADTQSMPITEAGQVVGTAAYMSPEQALGDPVDSRTDIFSLGTVLYEMCTARPAFWRETKTRILDAVLHQEPRPAAELNQEVSLELGRIISKCLAKRADERYQESAELLADLRTERRRIQSEEYEASHPSGVAMPPPRSNRALLIAMAAALVAVVAVFLALWPRETSPPQGRPRQLTSAPGWEADAAISPDGELVAYASNATGAAEIWLIDVRGGAPLRLTEGASLKGKPAWFPDGSTIAFHAQSGDSGAIWKVPRLGGPATMLMANATDPAISPDGTRIAFATASGGPDYRIAVASLADPADLRILTGPDHGLWGHRNPAWSPDGTRLCYHDFRDLWLVPAAGGEARQLTSESAGDHQPQWSPDGKFIYFSSHRDGTLALWRMPAKGGTPQRLTVGTGPESHPSVSRAGARLAYTTFVDDLDVVLADLGSGRQARLKGVRTDYGATFAPDGSAIVYVSNRTGHFQLWRQAIEGITASGQPLRLNDEAADSSNPDFSPDGKWIAYQRRSGADRNVWTLPAAGGLPRPFTQGPGVRIHPSWSPDGTEIAYFVEVDGRSELWVGGFDVRGAAGERRLIATAAESLMWPVWSPDGGRIAYLGSIGDSWEVWLSSVAQHRPPRRLTEGADATHLVWNVSQGTLLASGFWGEDSLSLREVDPADGQSRRLEWPIDFGPTAVYGMFDLSTDGSLATYTLEDVRGDVWVLEASDGAF